MLKKFCAVLLINAIAPTTIAGAYVEIRESSALTQQSMFFSEKCKYQRSNGMRPSKDCNIPNPNWAPKQQRPISIILDRRQPSSGYHNHPHSRVSTAYRCPE